jgi:iron(II)-dependent oxidoreductase
MVPIRFTVPELPGPAFVAGSALFVFVAVWPCRVQAQTASPDTPPPTFPAAAAFNAQNAPASARRQRDMVPIRAGTYTIGSPAGHRFADRLAMPEHRVTIRSFRIDRTEVTNAQFAEFLNALPVKPIGTALGSKVNAANIPAEHRWMLLEFSSRPAPYTMIDLDDDEALIGVRDGRFAANPGFENHPVTEITWAGALAYCRWRGARLPTEVEWEAAARGASRAVRSPGARPRPRPSWR